MACLLVVVNPGHGVSNLGLPTKMMVTVVNTMMTLPWSVADSDAFRAQTASERFAYFCLRSRRLLICPLSQR